MKARKQSQCTSEVKHHRSAANVRIDTLSTRSGRIVTRSWLGISSQEVSVQSFCYSVHNRRTEYDLWKNVQADKITIFNWDTWSYPILKRPLAELTRLSYCFQPKYRYSNIRQAPFTSSSYTVSHSMSLAFTNPGAILSNVLISRRGFYPLSPF